MSSEASSFQGLIASIQQAHDAFAAQASKAVNVSLTLRNWFIGHYIAEYQLKGADRATYGDHLLEALSAALRGLQVSNAGRRQLYGYLAFYRSYPDIVRTLSAPSLKLLVAPVTVAQAIGPALSTQSSLPKPLDPETLLSRLSYSHFDLLIEVAEPLKRLFYKVETLRGNWSVRELKRQIATQCFAAWRASTWRPLARQTRRPSYIGGTDIHHRLR